MSPKTKKKKDVLVGRDPTMQLYRAVRRYVESKKGSLVVIGGIRVEHWPGDNEHVYHIAVKCMGCKPEMAGDTDREGAGQ